MQPFLSVIIPAYNEIDNFKADVLESVQDYLSKRKYEWEVFVVDDGSTDGTFEALKKWSQNRPNWTIIKNPHKGKAFTVKTGVLGANGEYILISDFDQATPLSEVEKLLPFMKKGYDIVIGSREVKGSERLGEPWYRHLMGKVFNTVVQVFTIRGISDTQCGFKLFTNQAANNLFNSLIVYGGGVEKFAFTGAFDVELLYIAQKRKLKIAEVPISWRYWKTVRVNPVRDSIRMFLDVLRIRMTDLLGGYR